MDSPDSSQHLRSVSLNHIKATFKYPKYIPLSYQSLLKSHECEINCEGISYYVRRLNISDGSQLHFANQWLAAINQPMIDDNLFRTK